MAGLLDGFNTNLVIHPSMYALLLWFKLQIIEVSNGNMKSLGVTWDLSPWSLFSLYVTLYTFILRLPYEHCFQTQHCLILTILNKYPKKLPQAFFVMVYWEVITACVWVHPSNCISHHLRPVTPLPQAQVTFTSNTLFCQPFLSTNKGIVRPSFSSCLNI